MSKEDGRKEENVPDSAQLIGSLNSRRERTRGRLRQQWRSTREFTNHRLECPQYSLDTWPTRRYSELSLASSSPNTIGVEVLIVGHDVCKIGRDESRLVPNSTLFRQTR